MHTASIPVELKGISMSAIYTDNSLSIGRTPLVKLNRITAGAGATVLAKIEGRNHCLLYTSRCV